eukprot:CAMPEP_0172305988 /NCGR_PEP_ID=MMETSP1058-20130122/7169_1 /TAXON_ID=83371 /ORGANISM="Detonula confervacea, Strain CCMP 353" /LENGTH=462 /DNA_ID=CAMNT_0013017755 /DNA_START=241 /DNA_END=1626 /DNA_ORIENTATION=+
MGGPQYLYHKEGVHDSESSVIEYLNDNSGNKGLLHPDFLYKPSSSSDFSPPPRVVEFYAPWCPHCQHYAPRYKKLATEVMQVQPSIKFYAVSCVAHHDICKAHKINSYPVIKFFKEGSYESTKGGVNNGASSVLKELGFEGGAAAVAVGGGETDKLRKADKSPNHTDSNNDKEIARVVPFRDHDVHDAWWDASVSFEFALKNGIYMENGSLPQEKQEALREWLELLSKSLPSQMGRTHDIINAILKNFSRAVQGQSELDNLVRDSVPSEPSWAWRTCTYGDNKMGYTCGLWELFHIMSVGVVEYNQHNPPIATRHASETLRNYIDHFFQCDVCRINFLSMYDTCAFDGCHRLSTNPSLSEQEWRELPLWLWETHNDVNVRLLGERLDQNKETKPNQWESQQARWPPLFACPNCWREDRSWEEEKVFKHLHNMYWSGNPSYIKIPTIGTNDSGGGSRLIPLRW